LVFHSNLKLSAAIHILPRSDFFAAYGSFATFKTKPRCFWTFNLQLCSYLYETKYLQKIWKIYAHAASHQKSPQQSNNETVQTLKILIVSKEPDKLNLLLTTFLLLLKISPIDLSTSSLSEVLNEGQVKEVSFCESTVVPQKS